MLQREAFFAPTVGPYPVKSPITHVGQAEFSLLRKIVCPSQECKDSMLAM